MQPEQFQERFNVSRESLAKLHVYKDLLIKWQKAINLVGPKTLPDVWERHFADSAQLLPFLSMLSPRKRGSFIDPIDPRFRGEDRLELVDLGSGAGFPGLILAILRPDIKTHLVEADERKAQFLRTVSRETETPLTVHNARIEDMIGQITPDFVTARALAPLVDLLTYIRPWVEANPKIEACFLKGKAAQDEVNEALKIFDFRYEMTESVIEKGAYLVHLRDIIPRN